jgi:hypothetical protein
MPRKKYSQAVVSLSESKKTRLLYLGRNPDFLEDIRRFEKLRRQHQGDLVRIAKLVTPEADRLAAQWDLDWIDIAFLGAGLEPHPPQPVYSWTPGAEIGMGEATKTPNKELPFLHISVDLRYPVDLLVPLVERELRAKALGYPRGRARLDQIDFHLKIFDGASEGQTFPEIAARMRRKLSTVKSAYLVASRNIFGPQRGPSKRGAPLKGFDHEGHCQRCPVCVRAKTGQEMCGKARAYARVGQPRRRR